MKKTDKKKKVDNDPQSIYVVSFIDSEICLGFIKVFDPSIEVLKESNKQSKKKINCRFEKGSTHLIHAKKGLIVIRVRARPQNVHKKRKKKRRRMETIADNGAIPNSTRKWNRKAVHERLLECDGKWRVPVCRLRQSPFHIQGKVHELLRLAGLHPPRH